MSYEVFKKIYIIDIDTNKCLVNKGSESECWGQESSVPNIPSSK